MSTCLFHCINWIQYLKNSKFGVPSTVFCLISYVFLLTHWFFNVSNNLRELLQKTVRLLVWTYVCIFNWKSGRRKLRSILAVPSEGLSTKRTQSALLQEGKNSKIVQLKSACTDLTMYCDTLQNYLSAIKCYSRKKVLDHLSSTSSTEYAVSSNIINNQMPRIYAPSCCSQYSCLHVDLTTPPLPSSTSSFSLFFSKICL